MISIDVFSHVFTRSYRRAIERVIPNLGGRYPFTRENLLTDMDMRLVANPPKSVQIISVPVISEAEKSMDSHTFEATTHELEELVLDHPELFLSALARIDMVDPAWSARFVTDTIARSDSLVGIQMMTRENGLPLTVSNYQPLWKAIDTSRRPVFIHPLSHSRKMADCIDSWVKDLTQALADITSSTLLADYPHVRIVLHGGALLDERTLENAVNALSARSSVSRLYIDTALARTDQIQTASRIVGADHVLFSSEAPFASDDTDPLDMQSAAMRTVKEADLGDRATAAILGGTFTALRRTLPVNVKSEEDEYKEERAAADRKKAGEEEKRARELSDDSDDSDDSDSSDNETA